MFHLWTHSKQYTIWILSFIIMFSLFIEISSVVYGESLDEYTMQRTRGGVWAGVGIDSGSLEMSAEEANIKSRFDLLPSLVLGGDWWENESLGLFALAQVGLSAQLTLPDSVNANDIQLNQHRFQFGGIYQLHLNSRPNSLALRFRLGMHALLQSAPDQQPVFFVDSTHVGPELGLGIFFPFNNQMWLELDNRMGIPFLVREEQADSGLIETAVQLTSSLSFVAQLSSMMGVKVLASFSQYEMQFSDFGTRAKGVTNAKTFDQILGGGVAIWFQP